VKKTRQNKNLYLSAIPSLARHSFNRACRRRG
jgi:hypothetical protein